MGVIGREAVPVEERACAKTGVIKRDRRFSFRFSLVPRLSLAPYRLQDKAGTASHHLENLSHLPYVCLPSPFHCFLLSPVQGVTTTPAFPSPISSIWFPVSGMHLLSISKSYPSSDQLPGVFPGSCSLTCNCK